MKLKINLMNLKKPYYKHIFVNKTSFFQEHLQEIFFFNKKSRVCRLTAKSDKEKLKE